MQVCRLSLAIEEVIAEPSTYLKETIHMFSNHILHVKPQVYFTKIEIKNNRKIDRLIKRQIKYYVIKKCCDILCIPIENRTKDSQKYRLISTIDEKIGKKLD